MSGDIPQELEDYLSNEFILIADACAIFAGFIPISPYIADWSYEDSQRKYLDLDGKPTNPRDAGNNEIRRIQKKWKGSDWQVRYRNEFVIDRDPLNNEVSVREAFNVGFAMKIERVAWIHDAAVEANILPRETGKPIEHHTIQVTGLEAKGEVGEIPKPKHKFDVVAKPRASIPILIKSWLEIIRDQGDPAPINGAEDFLDWVVNAKPEQRFIRIEKVTKTHLDYFDEDKGKTIPYDKDAINERIKKYCFPI